MQFNAKMKGISMDEKEFKAMKIRGMSAEFSRLINDYVQRAKAALGSYDYESFDKKIDKAISFLQKAKDID
jgi:hypothetical protein